MLKTKKIVNSEYQFIRCLGEGLSSTVYEAVRSNSSGIQAERVAVKILKSENSVLWLQNEFESLRRVNSKACVRVLGHESFEEGPALILEYIEGVTLFELGSLYKLSEAEITQISAQVYQGLCAIEAAGCAHGDLNPKNILLTKSGDVKLIDFGSFADSSDLVGSLAYVPNQIWEGERASLASDLASLKLIIADLKTQFSRLPITNDQARARSREVSASENEFFCETTAAKELVARKVNELISKRATSVATAVLSRSPCSKISAKSIENRFFTASVLLITLAVLLPAQNLLSEPLKAAEKPIEPASLLIRTHNWTEVSVNDQPKGYAPINLQNLAPGKYRIKYKRSRGAGELIFSLNSGQKRLLRDVDFKD